MTNQVKLSSEIARLSCHGTRAIGGGVTDELARKIVEALVVEQDPELGLLLEDGEAYSTEDALVAALGTNDVVVNGIRLDVRTVDDAGQVSLPRNLVGTSYMPYGSLVVRMDGRLSGSVVGYISASQWQAADKNARDEASETHASLAFAADENFDLNGLLAKLASQEPAAVAPADSAAPDMSELHTILANRPALILARQRQIVERTLSHPETWAGVARVVSVWSKGATRRILVQGAVWNSRVDAMVNLLSTRFGRVKPQDIKEIILRTGESFGGQPESPEFRKSLLASLTREELSHSLGGQALRKALMIAEEVLAGRSAAEALQGFAKNKTAIDLAGAISKGRDKAHRFAEATSEELGLAFQKLALQPVYATHSQDPGAGIEAINETLKMLEAGELAEQVRKLEDELSGL